MGLTHKELFSNTVQPQTKISNYLNKNIDLIIEGRQFLAIGISVTTSTVTSFYVSNGSFPIIVNWFGTSLIGSIISIFLLAAFNLILIILAIFICQTFIDFVRYSKNKIKGEF